MFLSLRSGFFASKSNCKDSRGVIINIIVDVVVVVVVVNVVIVVDVVVVDVVNSNLMVLSQFFE